MGPHPYSLSLHLPVTLHCTQTLQQIVLILLVVCYKSALHLASQIDHLPLLQEMTGLYFLLFTWNRPFL